MKVLKYSAIGFIALTVIIIILLTIVNFTNINISKTYISELVKDTLGRDLTIEGDIKLKLLPVPGIRIDDIKFSNAAWRSSDYLLESETVDVKLDLKALFSGKVEINTIYLKSVKVDLFKDKNNAENWKFDIVETAEEIPENEQQNTEFASVILPFNPKVKVNLLDITVSYIDESANQNHKIHIDKLTIENIDNKTKLNIEAQYNDIDVELAIHTSLLKDLVVEENLPIQLTGNIGNIEIGVKTSIPLSQQASQQMQLALNLELDDLSTVKKLVDVEIPELGALDVNAIVSSKENEISVEIVKAGVGATKFSGDIKYITTKEIPELIAKLDFAKLDLAVIDKFSGTKNEAEENKSKTESTSLFSDEKLDLTILNELNADVDIKINDIDHDVLEFKTFKFMATLDNGLLNISKFEIENDRNERVNAKFRLNTGNNNETHVFLTMDSLQLAENKTLAKYLTGATTNANIKLHTKGDSVKALMSDLDGQLIIKVGEGTVDKDLLQFIGSNILMNIVDAVNPVSEESTTSVLECAAVRFDIKDGIATANKGIVMQTDQIQIISSGVINLQEETLEFGIKPQAREGVELNLNSFASMVKIDGSIIEPSINMSLQDTAIVYSYFATGGATFLAKSLFDTVTRDKNPCETAILGPDNTEQVIEENIQTKSAVQ